MTNERLERLWRACVKSGANADELLQDIAKQQAGPGGPAAVQAYESILSDLRARMSTVALAHAQQAASTPRPVAQVVYVRDEPTRLRPSHNPELDAAMGLAPASASSHYDAKSKTLTLGGRQ